ncbi:glycosyltransferase family 4 protein [Krasilnikoviella flava]|uniref:D-inositol 3-phosphate glycosyltransferase n=1 Tax=Krasilnikoviella flava TaxID=526729 RepID=A0A1T5IIB8_9MICO|nr:glycosyltransferase family 4 protein [Krasilnikoviella flava]SKC38850.1 Glycosyltransferase involved in cell wall bisynthesis [Krasilnikoviella flava]
MHGTPGTSSSPRPRLLLVTHHYPPEHGAPQRRWDTLTPRLMEAGVDVAVLAPPPHYPSGQLQDARAAYRPGAVSRGRHGERVVRTRFRPHAADLLSRTVDQAVAAASAVVLGLRYFRQGAERPDVVVGTVPGIPSMFAAWLLARLLRARLVIEMRDAWPDLIEPSGVLDARRSVASRLLAGARALVHRTVTRLQSRADAVVTTTETFAQVLLERGVRRVAVVRNGTSFQPLTSDDTVITSPLPDDADPGRARPLRAVYAGTVGRAQDLQSVVRAAAFVARRGLPLDVRIVGAGARVPFLEQLVAELDAPVTFVGPVPPGEIRRYYAWADTVIVSLRDWKPLEWTVPSKLYEVMASGAYATACVAGEAAALVQRSGAGSVVPPGDVAALTELWSGWAASGVVPAADPQAAQWVARNADDDTLAARYLDLLRELVEPVEASSRISTGSTTSGEGTR